MNGMLHSGRTATVPRSADRSSDRSSVPIIAEPLYSVRCWAQWMAKVGPSSAPTPPRKPGDPSKIKWLLVHVDGNDGDKVNVRVPINLIRTGIKLGAILPSGASERIQASGIDLNDLATLADEELVEALADLQVDVNSEDGDVVRIYCE